MVSWTKTSLQVLSFFYSSSRKYSSNGETSGSDENSVHEVCCPPTQVHLLRFLEGKPDSRQPDQHHVEPVDEEDEEEEPEASVVLFAVGLEGEAELAEVGDPIRQMVELHLGRKQNQNQTAAQTCRTHTGVRSRKQSRPRTHTHTHTPQHRSHR